MNVPTYQLQSGAESRECLISLLLYNKYSLQMEDVNLPWRLQCKVIKGEVINLSLEPNILPCSLNGPMVIQARAEVHLYLPSLGSVCFQSQTFLHHISEFLPGVWTTYNVCAQAQGTAGLCCVLSVCFTSWLILLPSLLLLCSFDVDPMCLLCKSLQVACCSSGFNWPSPCHPPFTVIFIPKMQKQIFKNENLCVNRTYSLPSHSTPGWNLLFLISYFYELWTFGPIFTGLFYLAPTILVISLELHSPGHLGSFDLLLLLSFLSSPFRL